jgi:sugar lactone lactonase YvrE
VLHDRLYSIEKNGCLYATDLSNGEWEQIGQADFANTVSMYAAGNSLYTIETDGSLYRVSPQDGKWQRVGQEYAWKETQAGAVVQGKLYTVESTGFMYATDLTNGTWVSIGKPEFANTVSMFAAGNSLYTIETDGSLYRVSPNDGSWRRIGHEGAWKPTRAGAVLKSQLFTVETNGCMYITDLTRGTWRQIGKAEFAGTIAMFPARDKIFTIEGDGSLYWVGVQ